MAAVPVTLNGVLYPKGRSADDKPTPCVCMGSAWITGLAVGGGPIFPPEWGPPVDPPIDVPPPVFDPPPTMAKPPPPDGGWGYAPQAGWGYFPGPGQAGPKH